MFHLNGDALDIDARLQELASQRAADIAIKIGEQAVSWAAFDKLVSQAANAFLEAGLEPGDRVATVGRNSLSYIATIFACLRAGGCITPLQTLTSENDLIRMINDSGATFLFVSSEFAPALYERCGALQSIDAGHIYCFDKSFPQIETFDRFIEGLPGTSPNISVDPHSGACLVYSSGTTGDPKGILQSRLHKARECEDMAEAGLSPAARVLITTPLCSSTTLFILFAALGNGATVVVMEKFGAEKFLKLSTRNRITHTILVPVQYERILTSEAFGRFDLSSYDVKISIGAPLRRSLKKEILDRWPEGGLIEFYGMTEGGPSCVLFAHESPDKLDTVGQPAEGCDVKIISDDGYVLPKGKAGEIVGRSGRMMVGYWNRPTETREASWYDSDGNRFLKSGDIGWFDDEGFLHLVDRKKDVIISGGFNIYATDLENVICDHPNVLEAAIVGAPSAKWGETPVAFVVLRDGAESDAASIKEWTNSKLGKVQRLSAVHLIDALPRNDIGKVAKRNLRSNVTPQP